MNSTVSFTMSFRVNVRNPYGLLDQQALDLFLEHIKWGRELQEVPYTLEDEKGNEYQLEVDFIPSGRIDE